MTKASTRMARLAVVPLLNYLTANFFFNAYEELAARHEDLKVSKDNAATVRNLAIESVHDIDNLIEKAGTFIKKTIPIVIIQ